MKSNQCVSLQKASFLIAFFLFSLSSISQQFNWANTLTAKQLNIATNEITGDVYISGTFEDSLVMRSSVSTTSVIATNSGFREAFVAKLDAFGGIDWFKTFGGTPSAISVNEMILDHSGAILLSGRFSDSTDFAPGLPVHTRTAFSSSDGYVLKLDSAGNFVWVTQIQGIIQNESLKSLVVDNQNNVFFWGDIFRNSKIVSTNSIDSITVYYRRMIVKLNQNGDFVKHSMMGESVYDLAFDALNNLYVSVSVVYNNNNDLRNELVKLDTNFQEVWRRAIVKNTENVKDCKLVIDNANSNVYVISDINIIVDKYTFNNNNTWRRELEYHPENVNNVVRGASLNSSGNVVVSGDFVQEINLKFDQSNFILNSHVSNSNSFMAIYNPQGDVTWANKTVEQLDIQNQSDGNFVHNTISSLNSITTLGSFSGKVDLNPNYTGFVDSTINESKFYIQNFSICNNPISYDSIQTCKMNISPTNSGLWKQNGNYHEVFPGVNGCDSIAVFDVKIELDTLTEIIHSCDPFYVPNSNLIIDRKGVYYVHKANALGCDSVYEYDYTKYLRFSNTSATVCDSFPNHDSTKFWTKSGFYNDTIPRVLGCDLINRINLKVIEIDTSLVLSDYMVISKEFPSDCNFRWFDCDNGMTPFMNQTNYYYRITEEANVALRITKNDCVKFTSCVKVKPLTSVNELNSSKTNFTVYPNPTHNAITLSWSEHKEKITIRLRNTLGQVVLESTASGMSKNIDFNLAQGVYLLEIEEEGNAVHVQKLIVK